MTDLPPNLLPNRLRNGTIGPAREGLDEITREERDDGRVPKVWAGGVQSGNEVDDADEEDTFDGAGEG